MHPCAYTPEKFWRRLAKASADECWVWTGGRDKDGYGRCMYHYKHWFCHRLAYTLTYGPIPPGLHVLHKCDNPPCCNPSHLRVGTEAENKADMVAKGRSAKGNRVNVRANPALVRRGEANGNSRLTPDIVLAVRAGYAKGATQTELGRAFDISLSQIHNIVLRIQWAHI